MSRQSLVINVGANVAGVQAGLTSTQRMVDATRAAMERQTATAERALRIEQLEQQILTYKLNGQKTLQRHAESMLRTEQLAADLRRRGIATDEQALKLAQQRVRLENEVALARRMQDPGSGGGRVGNMGNGANVRRMGRGGSGGGGGGGGGSGGAGAGGGGNFGYEAGVAYNFVQDLAQGGITAVANNVPQLLQSAFMKAIFAPLGAITAVGTAIWQYEAAIKDGVGPLHAAAKGIRNFWITNFGDGDTRTAGEKETANFKEGLALNRQRNERKSAAKEGATAGAEAESQQKAFQEADARTRQRMETEREQGRILRDEAARLEMAQINAMDDKFEKSQKLFEFERKEMIRNAAEARKLAEEDMREAEARQTRLKQQQQSAQNALDDLKARPGDAASPDGLREVGRLTGVLAGLASRVAEADARYLEMKTELGDATFRQEKQLPLQLQQKDLERPQQGFGTTIQKGVQESPLASILGSARRGMEALQTGDALAKNKRDITQAREIEDMKAQQQQTQQQGGRVSRRDEKKLRDLEKDYSVRQDTNSLIQQGFTPDEAAKMASSSYAAQNPEPSRGRIKGAKSERNAFRGLNDQSPSRLDNQTFDGLDKQNFGGLDALQKMQTASREKPKGKEDAGPDKTAPPPPVQGGVGMLLPILQAIKGAVDRGVAAQRMKSSTPL